MEGSVLKVHLQVSCLGQAIHLPREAVSVGAEKKVVVKNTAWEANTLQQAIEPLCFLISEREEEKYLPTSKESRRIRGCSGLHVSTSHRSSVRRGRGLAISVANAVAAFPSWLVVTGASGQPPKPPACWEHKNDSRVPRHGL